MDLPVRVHIARIEREIESLSLKLMQSNDRLVANEMESNIRSLKLALSHYELALEIEEKVLNKAEAGNTAKTVSAQKRKA